MDLEKLVAPGINWLLISAPLLIMAWGVLLMVADLVVDSFRKDDHRQWAAGFSIVGLLLAGALSLYQWVNNITGSTFIPYQETVTEGATIVSAVAPAMVVLDSYAIFLNLLFVACGVFGILISLNYLGKVAIVEKLEYYMLVLFSISGMMLMGMANDLILVFIALELLSIPLYILCGMARPKLESEEAGIKYFLLGAFSSAFLVFGLALVYGATGSTALPTIAANFTGTPIALAGLALILVGLGFKVGAVPFHMWTPDVYEGAPTSVTAFMSVGAKIGGFAALIRFLIATIPAGEAEKWAAAVAILAALTMIVGNVVALAQNNIKRVLAYSSIAHAGYILMAVAANPMNQDNYGVTGALVYMLSYLFTTFGAFAIILMVERNNYEGVSMDDYKGLAKHNLWYALALTLFMLSLTGMPLTGGFIGKYYVFNAAIQGQMYWLAIVGVLTSVVSAYFYLRVVFYMFMYEGETVLEEKMPLTFTVIVAAVVTLFLGIAPMPFITFTQQALLLLQ